MTDRPSRPTSGAAAEILASVRERMSRDDGSASLEFVTAGLILLLPLVYLVLAVATIQGGAFAVEGAARQAARVFVLSPDRPTAEAAALRAVEFALLDHGVDPAASDIVVSCSEPTDCFARSGMVTVQVSVQVALPLVPPVLDLRTPLSVPLEASATQQVSRFWRAG